MKPQWPTPQNNNCVYALVDPNTGEIKYVGITTRGVERFDGHWRDFRKNKLNPKNNLSKKQWWVKQLKANNTPFLVIYLDYALDVNELYYKEKQWIALFKNKNIELLNHTDGGFNPSPRPLTKEEKLELSKRTKEGMRKPQSWDKFMTHIKNRVNIGHPYPHKQETKNKISQSSYHTSLKRKIKCSNGVVFESQNDAAKFFKVTKASISAHLRGKIKSVKGHTFERVSNA